MHGSDISEGPEPDILEEQGTVRYQDRGKLKDGEEKHRGRRERNKAGRDQEWGKEGRHEVQVQG